MNSSPVRAARERLGLYQGQVAEILGVNRRTVARWEQEQLEPNEVPNISRWSDIADLLCLDESVIEDWYFRWLTKGDPVTDQIIRDTNRDAK